MGEHKQILLVEDDKSYRTLIQMKLKQLGLEVLTGDNGVQDLSLLESHKVDLVILDLLMPEMSGWNFMYEKQKTNKKNVPVMILTNLTEASYPSETEHNIDFLVKANISIDELVGRVKKRLS